MAVNPNRNLHHPSFYVVKIRLFFEKFFGFQFAHYSDFVFKKTKPNALSGVEKCAQYFCASANWLLCYPAQKPDRSRCHGGSEREG